MRGKRPHAREGVGFGGSARGINGGGADNAGGVLLEKMGFLAGEVCKRWKGRVLKIGLDVR